MKKNMNENLKISGIYVRALTEDQAREGFSLPEQEACLKEFRAFKRYNKSISRCWNIC